MSTTNGINDLSLYFTIYAYTHTHTHTHIQVNRVVERRPLKCTHFDATRHFPEAALAMNRIRPPPGPGTRLEQEQPGCLHTNCDLFKWATQVRRRRFKSFHSFLLFIQISDAGERVSTMIFSVAKY